MFKNLRALDADNGKDGYLFWQINFINKQLTFIKYICMKTTKIII